MVSCTVKSICQKFLRTPHGLSKTIVSLQIYSVVSYLLKINVNPMRKIPKVIRDSVSTVTYLVFYSHKKAGNGQRRMQ